MRSFRSSTFSSIVILSQNFFVVTIAPRVIGLVQPLTRCTSVSRGYAHPCRRRGLADVSRLSLRFSGSQRTSDCRKHPYSADGYATSQLTSLVRAGRPSHLDLASIPQSRVARARSRSAIDPRLFPAPSALIWNAASVWLSTHAIFRRDVLLGRFAH